jgi:hypothetical protein
MMQTIKFLILKPSPLHILNTLGPKYSPQYPLYKILIEIAEIKFLRYAIGRIVRDNMSYQIWVELNNYYLIET